MPPDPRDDAFATRLASLNVGLMLAIERGSMEGITAHLNQLFALMIEHNKTLRERPGDEPLRRAIERIGA
jgi:hypothetical protein